MKALKPVLAILGARWFWTLAGAVLLSLLIWNFGDLLRIGEKQPFGSETARLTAILAIAVLWGFSNLWAQARARRNNDQLVKALVGARGTIRARIARSAGAGAAVSGSSGAAAPKQGRRRPRPKMALPTAVVRHDWAARIGQDDRARSVRSAIPHRRGARSAGGRRYPLLRLALHRRGGPDRHRRPLHHPGQRRRR